MSSTKKTTRNRNVDTLKDKAETMSNETETNETETNETNGTESNETKTKRPKPRRKAPKAPKAPLDESNGDDTESNGGDAGSKGGGFNVDGFALKDDADEKTVERVKAETESIKAAVESINNKDADLLSAYLHFGKFQSGIRGLFKSAKVYGQFLAAEVPATQALDPALRSNCKWLYEALHDPEHEASDLLSILGLDTTKNDPESAIAEYKSQNPTVIKRDYKALKAEAERSKAVAEKAEEDGLSEEEAAEALAEAKKAETSIDVDGFLAAVRVQMVEITTSAPKNKSRKEVGEACADEAVSLFRAVFEAKNKKALKAVVDGYLTPTETKTDDDE